LVPVGFTLNNNTNIKEYISYTKYLTSFFNKHKKKRDNMPPLSIKPTMLL
tara:strand:+ start:5220 stop:5369 length:150 start_codon:yes stop_codon:yes gene_type:complete